MHTYWSVTDCTIVEQTYVRSSAKCLFQKPRPRLDLEWTLHFIHWFEGSEKLTKSWMLARMEGISVSLAVQSYNQTNVCIICLYFFNLSWKCCFMEKISLSIVFSHAVILSVNKVFHLLLRRQTSYNLLRLFFTFYFHCIFLPRRLSGGHLISGAFLS